MNTQRLTQVRNLYAYSDLVHPRITRHNQRAWIRSVRILGSKWLLAEPVQRIESQKALRQSIIDQQRTRRENDEYSLQLEEQS